jgi:phosphatidylinositol 4-kinase
VSLASLGALLLRLEEEDDTLELVGLISRRLDALLSSSSHSIDSIARHLVRLPSARGKRTVKATVHSLHQVQSVSKLLAEEEGKWDTFAGREREGGEREKLLDFSSRLEAVRASSPFGREEGWTCSSFIVKFGDDIAQEAFAMRLVQVCVGAWSTAQLPTARAVRTYPIVATAPDSGILGTLLSSPSLDSLYKTVDYGPILQIYRSRFGPDDSAAHAAARLHFVESLAAWSVLTYVFSLKDRHNGNILIDPHGFLAHIDFGFLLTSSPGNWSFERAPFKMAPDWLEFMGGQRSRLFVYFRRLFLEAFVIVRSRASDILELTRLALRTKPAYPCFVGGEEAVLTGLRARLLLDDGPATDLLANHVDELISLSLKSSRTYEYDLFQWYQNQIAFCSRATV